MDQVLPLYYNIFSALMKIGKILAIFLISVKNFKIKQQEFYVITIFNFCS